MINARIDTGFGRIELHTDKGISGAIWSLLFLLYDLILTNMLVKSVSIVLEVKQVGLGCLIKDFLFDNVFFVYFTLLVFMGVVVE